MRLVCLASLGVVSFLLGGCHPEMRQAKSQAQRDFDCSRNDLEVTRRSQDTFIVSGCERTGIYQCPEAPGVTSRFCVNLALMARNRGENEFRCDFANVTVEEISPFVFRAEGCGREAVYHCEASDGRPRCLLEREGEVPVSSGAAAPATEPEPEPAI